MKIMFSCIPNHYHYIVKDIYLILMYLDIYLNMANAFYVSASYLWLHCFCHTPDIDHIFHYLEPLLSIRGRVCVVDGGGG